MAEYHGRQLGRLWVPPVWAASNAYPLDTASFGSTPPHYPDVHRAPCPLASPGSGHGAGACVCTHLVFGHRPVCPALHDVERLAPERCTCQPLLALFALALPPQPIDGNAYRAFYLDEGTPVLMTEALDEAIARGGFADRDEFFALVSSPNLDLTNPEAMARFQQWKTTDGSKAGLLAAFPALRPPEPLL